MTDGVDRWKLGPDQLVEESDLRFYFWDNQREYNYVGSSKEAQIKIEYEDLTKKGRKGIRKNDYKYEEKEGEFVEVKEGEKANALNFFKKAAKRKEKLKKN